MNIEAFLKEYFTINGNYTINSNYTISDDGVINVDSSISLKYNDFNKLNLKKLPIQFGYVTGNLHFNYSDITTLKGFPHTVDGYFSIDNSKKLTSLEFSPKSELFSCHDCSDLESLDGLNCKEFYGNRIKLKRFGTNFTAKIFTFNNFPTPTADEMRRFIQLNPEFVTEQQAPWITLIKDYSEHKDIFIAIAQFEELYGEPWIKLEDKIEINQSLDGLSL